MNVTHTDGRFAALPTEILDQKSNLAQQNQEDQDNTKGENICSASFEVDQQQDVLDSSQAKNTAISPFQCQLQDSTPANEEDRKNLIRHESQSSPDFNKKNEKERAKTSSANDEVTVEVAQDASIKADDQQPPDTATNE